MRGVRKVAGGEAVAFRQAEDGTYLTLAADRRDPLFTVLALTLDAPVGDGTVIPAGDGK